MRILWSVWKWWNNNRSLFFPTVVPSMHPNVEKHVDIVPLSNRLANTVETCCMTPPNSVEMKAQRLSRRCCCISNLVIHLSLGGGSPGWTGISGYTAEGYGCFGFVLVSCPETNKNQNIWGFPKMGVPQKHPFSLDLPWFSNIYHPYFRVPPFMEIPIWGEDKKWILANLPRPSVKL